MNKVIYQHAFLCFLLILSAHIFLISLLTKKSVTKQKLTQLIEPTLLVKLLPSPKVSILTSQNSTLSQRKTLAAPRPSPARSILTDNSADHGENVKEQQITQENLADSIHNTKHWAREFSKNPS
jgi:hypothetical protein